MARKAARKTGENLSSNENRRIRNKPESNNTFNNSVSKHEDNINSYNNQNNRGTYLRDSQV